MLGSNKEVSPDIYFEKNFCKLYEKIEKGIAETIIFECEYGKVQHAFIKRPIEETINGVQYYDLVTAYGYGGPIVLSLNCDKEEEKENAKKLLIEKFGEYHKNYCSANNIVSEFVRFHPLFNNAEDFKDIFRVEYLRNTVGTNLKAYPDFMAEEYAKGCRKNIRQAIKKGISVEVIEKPESLQEFKTVYYSTMDRNEASEYYYFDDEYFNKCLEYYRDHILLVKAVYEDKVIAAGFYFVWDKVVHIHLSGTLSEYLFLSPAYMLRYGVTNWAVEHGYETIHHGGGRSNDAEDTLFKFKKQFGKNTEYPFCVGKQIWNEEVYARLNDGKVSFDGFFPGYRER